MKFYLLTIFVFFARIGFSQVNFDFESDSLKGWQQSVDGHWAASADNPLNGKYSLHQIFDNPVAGHDQISYSFQKKIDFNSPVHWSLSYKVHI